MTRPISSQPARRRGSRLVGGLAIAWLALGPTPPSLAAEAASLSLLQGSGLAASVPDDALWWRSAGDPVLSQLIERGLATDKSLMCEAQSLRKSGEEARSRGQRLDRRIARLFGKRGEEAAGADLRARAFDYADHRALLAARIAAAYVEVRRLQEVAALRARVQAQFKDNSEIARFRREAGLVDGLDVSLAGSLVAINGDSIEAERQGFRDKAAELSALTGMDEAALLTSLGQDGKVPDLVIAAATPAAPNAGAVGTLYRADLLALARRLVAILLREEVSAPDIADALAASDGSAPASTSDPGDKKTLPARSVARLRAAGVDARAQVIRERDALAATAARLASLDKKARETRNTAVSARVAYRNGMVPFAALYAAEAAGAGLAEAGVGARATLAAGRVRLARALGLGWTASDLEPGPYSLNGNEVLVCE